MDTYKDLTLERVLLLFFFFSFSFAPFEKHAKQTFAAATKQGVSRLCG